MSKFIKHFCVGFAGAYLLTGKHTPTKSELIAIFEKYDLVDQTTGDKNYKIYTDDFIEDHHGSCFFVFEKEHDEEYDICVNFKTGEVWCVEL